MKRSIAAGLLMFVLMGCVTQKPFEMREAAKMAVPGTKFPGKATVVVFRGQSLGEALWPMSVEVDGARQGMVRPGTYLRFPVEAGPHVVNLSRMVLDMTPSIALRAEFEPGKTYYFLYRTRVEMVAVTAKYISEIVQLNREQAVEMLRTTRDVGWK